MKQGLKIMFTVFVFLVLLFMAYVRVSPLNAEDWHVPIEAQADANLSGGAIRVIDGDVDTLRRIDQAAKALKRTRVLAGSLAEGRITYVTRSVFFGFPDMTTVELDGNQIKLFARARFGSSDMGVNVQRLQRLIVAVE